MHVALSPRFLTISAERFVITRFADILDPPTSLLSMTSLLPPIFRCNPSPTFLPFVFGIARQVTARSNHDAEGREEDHREEGQGQEGPVGLQPVHEV